MCTYSLQSSGARPSIFYSLWKASKLRSRCLLKQKRHQQHCFSSSTIFCGVFLRHGVPSSRNKNVESISVSKWKSNSSSLLKIYASTFPIDMSEVVETKLLGIIQTIKNLRCLEWSFLKIKKVRRKWEKGVAKACYYGDCHVSSFSSFWDPLLKSRHFQWNCRENFNTHWRLYM